MSTPEQRQGAENEQFFQNFRILCAERDIQRVVKSPPEAAFAREQGNLTWRPIYDPLA